MASVLLALHPLDELWVEAQVVSDAVLPTVVRRREEREVCAEENLFEHFWQQEWMRRRLLTKSIYRCRPDSGIVCPSEPL